MSTGVGVRSEAEIEAMETDALLRLYKQTGDEALKWPLVLRYEGMIKNAALQVRGVFSGFAQVEDIVNEGILTLLAAVDKFDPDKGVKFETYVAKRIRGMVIDLARKQDWLPRNVRQRAREIDEAVADLSNELGRFPTEREVADRLGVPLERYQKDSTDMDAYRFELTDRDERGQPEAALQDRELQETLAAGIGSLQENEQIVLSLYYEKNLHMKEIAQVMELSEPRISQIHARAIQKLREYMTEYMTGKPGQKQPKKRKKG